MAVNILVIFAHPLFERSRANKELVNNIPLSDHITFHDLYELYPDFNIDIAEEQRLLQTHDIIIWHHPFYWYSCPPLLKQWIDMVLEAGWAYGPGGKALEGKRLLQVITTGGPSFAYQPEGNNKHTIHTFLSPFRQTAELCHMTYMPPFVVHGTHRLTTEEIKDFGAQYKMLFHRLLTGEAIDIPYSDEKYMNHWLKKTSTP
jgi:glutathione-regulated potassium-efflux system ancillary protein KefG